MADARTVLDPNQPQVKAQLLRWLAGRVHPEHALGDCAAKFELTLDDVRDAVTMHGFPRPEAMRRAAGILDGSSTARPVAAEQPRTATTVTPDTVPDPAQLEIANLLALAEKSPKAATRNLAGKIRKTVTDLRDRVDAEQAERQEQARLERERAKARSEVARLRAELAEAEKALGTKPKAPATGVDSKAVRAWAADNGIDCPKVGRIHRDIVEKYHQALG